VQFLGQRSKKLAGKSSGGSDERPETVHIDKTISRVTESDGEHGSPPLRAMNE